MNLLSLINSSPANVYCSITLSNHKAIRLKKFVSQFTRGLCILAKFFWKLKKSGPTVAVAMPVTIQQHTSVPSAQVLSIFVLDDPNGI